MAGLLAKIYKQDTKDEVVAAESGRASSSSWGAYNLAMKKQVPKVGERPDSEVLFWERPCVKHQVLQS